MVHEQFLNRTNNSWKPAYAFRNTSFNSVIEEYRKKYKLNKSPSLVANFNSKYTTWLLGQKALENARKREFQRLISSLRTPKIPIARQPSPRRSGKPRNTGSLRRQVLTASIRARREELQRQRAALERQRNRLEALITETIKQLRSLPA